jgi:hypothetical protein
MLGGWENYKLVSEPGFQNEPRWARKVEVEEKVSEGNCCQNGKN